MFIILLESKLNFVYGRHNFANYYSRIKIIFVRNFKISKFDFADSFIKNMTVIYFENNVIIMETKVVIKNPILSNFHRILLFFFKYKNFPLETTCSQWISPFL